MDENKVYILSTFSANFEEHDTEPDKRMIISVKEHVYMLADEIPSYSPNLPDTPFVLSRSPVTVKAQDVSETTRDSLNSLTVIMQ